MILHSVFCDFRQDASAAERDAVLKDLAAFSATLPGVIQFDHGPNRDFEAKSARYDAGFVIRFENENALTHYAEHPVHKTLGAKLCTLCTGGADGIIVFDLAC